MKVLIHQKTGSIIGYFNNHVLAGTIQAWIQNCIDNRSEPIYNLVEFADDGICMVWRTDNLIRLFTPNSEEFLELEDIVPIK